MFRKSIYAFIILFGALISVNAQNSQVLYYMNLPQNHLLNPALRPSNSFYLGLPALSGLNINLNNNFVNLSDILITGQSDSILTFLHPDYNIEDFVSKLKDNNFLAADIGIQILGLGFSAGNDLYFFLDIIDRAEGNLIIPGDLLKLGLKGNEDYIGTTIDLNSLNANLKYYREYGLGFSKNFGTKLRIGIKAKLLTGIAALNIQNNSLGLTVNDDFTHSIDADLSANISFPAKFYFDEDNLIDDVELDENTLSSVGFFTNTSNMGLGLDLGAVYNISEKLSVSASVTDLGYIKWKDNITNFQAKSNFLFSGFDITDVIDGTVTFDSLLTNMQDSLLNSFTFSDNKTPFTTFLPTGITVGASYNLTRSFGVGLLSRSIISSGHFRQAVTLSANLNLGNSLSTSLSYTAMNTRYDNFGAGLAFRAGFFQLYLVADRIPVTWNRILPEEGSEITVPANWNTATFRFGINFCFGNKVKTKNDKPMLIERNQ